MLESHRAIAELGSCYRAIFDAIAAFRTQAGIVQDVVVHDPEVAHLAPLAGQARENMLLVTDSLLDTIPGELGEMMETAREFAGE
jgi:hypothetical protein